MFAVVIHPRARLVADIGPMTFQNLVEFIHKRVPGDFHVVYHIRGVAVQMDDDADLEVFKRLAFTVRPIDGESTTPGRVDGKSGLPDIQVVVKARVPQVIDGEEELERVGDGFRCKLCNVVIQSRRNTSVLAHVGSERHKAAGREMPRSYPLLQGFLEGSCVADYYRWAIPVYRTGMSKLALYDCYTQ